MHSMKHKFTYKLANNTKLALMHAYVTFYPMNFVFLGGVKSDA